MSFLIFLIIKKPFTCSIKYFVSGSVKIGSRVMSDEFILTRGEKRQRMDVAHSRVCSFGNSLTAPTLDEEEKKREKEKETTIG